MAQLKDFYEATQGLTPLEDNYQRDGIHSQAGESYQVEEDIKPFRALRGSEKVLVVGLPGLQRCIHERASWVAEVWRGPAGGPAGIQEVVWLRGDRLHAGWTAPRPHGAGHYHERTRRALIESMRQDRTSAADKFRRAQKFAQADEVTMEMVRALGWCLPGIQAWVKTHLTPEQATRALERNALPRRLALEAAQKSPDDHYSGRLLKLLQGADMPRPPTPEEEAAAAELDGLEAPNP